MNQEIFVKRGFTGEPLGSAHLEELRLLISQRGARALVKQLGVSVTAIERAGAGGRIHRGTSVLIAAGLQRLREAGEIKRALP